MKTMICLILDRSGSMAGREADVIGGINSFIDEQQKLPDPASIAMVRFDTEAIERFRSMGPLADAKHITAEDFQPRGGTPLLDAVGRTVTALDTDWKTEQPERCVVVIVTDGEENSSKEFTKAKVKELIQSRQESGKWAFIYLGANVDSFTEASAMGVSSLNTANYVNTHKGIAAAYSTVAQSVNMMRTTGATYASNLGGDITEDGSLNKSGLNGLTIAPQPQAPAPAPAPTPQPTWTAPTKAKAWTPPA